MLQLTINEKGGATRQEAFEKDEVTIGRVQGNDIILPKGNISKRHSRIVLKDGKLIIVDLKSTNGTYVNGKKITAPQVIKTTDKVYIGDFTIQIEPASNGASELAQRGRSMAGAEEEIDLFGGEAAFDPEPPPADSPGLIDDNFDQEFEAPQPDPASKARLQRPSQHAPRAQPLPLDEQFEDVGHLAPAPQVPFEAQSKPDPEPIGPRLEPAPAEAALPPDLEETPLPQSEQPAQTAVPHSGRFASMVPSAQVFQPAAALEPVDREAVLADLQLAIASELDLAGRSLDEVPALRDDALAIVEERLTGLMPRLPPEERLERLASAAVGRCCGLEGLADLLTDDAIFEVVVTPDRQILVDREGRLEPAGRTLETEREVLFAIHSLAACAGRVPTTDLGPLVDVRLRDGARVLATLPPVAFRGPSLSVRKTTRDFFTLEKLKEYDTIDGAMLSLLDAAVRHRKSVLLSTGPGVTATATLNALLSQASGDERLVTGERGIELHLRGHNNAVGFELGTQVEVQDILTYASAAQAERVVFGELREQEAAPVIEAFAETFDGSAASVGASSAREAVDRLARWLASSGEDEASEEKAARALIRRGFTLVLQEHKLSDNSRRITEVCELVEEDSEVRLEEIFRFEATGVDESMMITGSFVPSGRVPRFLAELSERGEADVDLSIYQA